MSNDSGQGEELHGCAVSGGGVPPTECADLANSPEILDKLATALRGAGLVDARLPAGQLIFLALLTRLHERPVSLVIKAASSGGKSWLVKTVLEFVPATAYYALSAMSERALAYSKEPIAHRFLVLYEAEALNGEFASYLVRSLLSEGKVKYETVESGPGGLTPKLIEREGPTGLLTTTTRFTLHPENETRLLSVSLADSADGQREVFQRWGAEAAGTESPEVDSAQWHALGAWLEQGERRVVIPYAPLLADLLPARALRLQRDFIQALALVKAHALLHRATRDRDSEGRIVASLDDYAAVRELIEPLIAAGIEAIVRPELRQTIEAVRSLLPTHPHGVPQTALREWLALDKATVSRRVRGAIRHEWLRNEEERRGRPSRLVLGDALPDDACVCLADEHAAKGRRRGAAGTQASGRPGGATATARGVVQTGQARAVGWLPFVPPYVCVPAFRRGSEREAGSGVARPR